jgi:hypothetical protein
MDKAKQKMLEKKGWRVGTAEEFLGLSPAEFRCIELKLALSKSGSGHTLGTVNPQWTWVSGWNTIGDSAAVCCR